MKFFITIVLTVASVSALGSGPYLPSGWRPEGPAFFLPSENQKPVQVPVKETTQENIASGSDSLQEYGPPKLEVIINESVQETEASNALREVSFPKVQEVSQDIANQGLPDVITEQIFAAEVKETNANVEASEVPTVDVEKVETAVNDEQRTVEDGVTLRALTEEVSTDATLVEEKQVIEEIVTQSNIVSEEGITESAVDESTKANFEGRSLDVGITAEVSEKILEDKIENTESVESEKIVEVIQEVVETAATVAALEEKVEKIEEVVQFEVKSVDESVKSIEQTLVNLGNEIKTEQVQNEVQIKTTEDNSGSLAVPEGFLEYGPPGFREYGPPKEDLLLPAVAQVTTNDVSVNNEARKRRFSPKFRASKNPKRGH